jgi:hypothetical protein
MMIEADMQQRSRSIESSLNEIGLLMWSISPSHPLGLFAPVQCEALPQGGVHHQSTMRDGWNWKKIHLEWWDALARRRLKPVSWDVGK